MIATCSHVRLPWASRTFTAFAALCALAYSAGVANASPARTAAAEARPTHVPVAQFSPTSALQMTPSTSADAGSVEYAYTDNSGRLWHGHQPDADVVSIDWSEIHDGQVFTGRPVLSDKRDGKLEIVALHTSGTVWLRTRQAANPPLWDDWRDLGGHAAVSPAVVRRPDGGLLLFAVDDAGRLRILSQDSASGDFHPWTDSGLSGLVGHVTAAPVEGGVRVFFVDATGAASTVLYTPGDGGLPGTVDSPVRIGDRPVTAAPTPVPYPRDVLRLVAKTPDGRVVTMMQEPHGWFPAEWSTVGDFVTAGTPTAILDPSFRAMFQILARGADGLVYGAREAVQATDEWHPWSVFPEAAPTATDPTPFDYRPLGANATWRFVIRDPDDRTFVYTIDPGPGTIVRCWPEPCPPRGGTGQDGTAVG